MQAHRLRTRVPARTLAALATLVLAVAPLARAQDADLTALSLDELMNMKVDISSNREKTVREQPGIVSVITAEDIRRQGARDLVDVLNLVPGYQFGTDLGGVVGPVFRGMWAYEGKTQVIVDGLEMNEGSFGTLPIRNRFPAATIKQIEIIRGPGSALYGGTAELSVIRITTKGAEQNGAFAQSSLAATSEKVSQLHSFGVGYQLPQDFRFSLSGSYRDDYLSDEDYTDLDVPPGDERYNLADGSTLEPYNVNLGVGWKDLQTQFIYDFYDVTTRHSVGDVRNGTVNYQFITRAALVKYDLKPTDWLTITPKITYRDQKPWRRIRVGQGAGFQTFENTRIDYSLTGQAEINEKSSLMVGSEIYHDRGRWARGTTFTDGSRNKGYDAWSVFSQYEIDTALANFTVGGRFEEHDALEEGSFVPRFGMTRVWDKLHAKALYSQAFRTPNQRVIDEAAPGQTLEPEKAESYEIEVGYQFTKQWALTGNVFYTTLENPYLYFDSAGGYVYSGEVSTYGLEAELKHFADWGTAAFGYSFYRPDRNTVPLFDSGEADRLLGSAAHKLTANVTFNLSKNLTWNVNAFLLSEARAAVQSVPDANSFYRIASFDPQFVVNTYVEYLWRGFNFGVGINDLLDEHRQYYQPYNGGSGILPEKGREYVAKVGYKF